MLVILPRNVGSYTYAATGYANPHAATSVGGATLTYDNNGNVTAIGSLDYTWDWRNRLASAERNAGGSTSYGYDHTGQRVFKATGTATTSYPTKYFNLATTTGAATTTKHIFAPDGTFLATVEQSGVGTATTTFLHPDHLSGTNVVTDENGEVVQTLDYYPYGSQRIATGSFSEHRRFIGEELDLDTEFSYLNARYYEGSRGQFLSQDPVFWEIGITTDGKNALTNPQAINSYAYSNNNPIRFSDPQGRWYKEFITGQQSWSSFQLELGEAADYLGRGNRAWNFAFEHPVATGIGIVGPLSGAAAVSGVAATAAFHAATYPGVSVGYAASKLTAGFVYSILGINTGLAIPKTVDSLSRADINKPSSYYRTVATVGAIVIPQVLGGYAGAITDVAQFPSALGTTIGDAAKALGVGNTGGGKFIGTYNFGSDVGTYDFGGNTWVAPR